MNETDIIEKGNICYNIKFKNDKFFNEQSMILNNLEKILNLDNDNRSFILYYLDNNTEQQKQILALIPEIRKYFSCGSWTAINRSVKKKYLSLLRSIYKSMGYSITRKMLPISINNEVIYTQKYIITKL